MKKSDKVVFRLSAAEHTLHLMPKYYPASRCGVHGDTKYNRTKTNRNFRKELQDEQSMGRR